MLNGSLTEPLPTNRQRSMPITGPQPCSPIVGASKVPHLDEAVDALDVKLSAEECTFLEEPYQPHPVVGPL